MGVKSHNSADLNLDIEDGVLSSALAHLGNVSWQLDEVVEPGTKPSLASQNPRVQQALGNFEFYLTERIIDYTKTPLALGRVLTIDPTA